MKLQNSYSFQQCLLLPTAEKRVIVVCREECAGASSSTLGSQAPRVDRMDSTSKYRPVSTTRETHLARHCGLCIGYCWGYGGGNDFPGRGYRRSLIRTSCRGFVLCVNLQGRNCENRCSNQS
jgi:hypothetical protein